VRRGQFSCGPDALRREYDVVVIGSGLGGLTCAAVLAEAGAAVAVVEQFTNIGGCCQCYRRGGYTFDVSVHSMYNWGYLGRLLARLGEPLAVVPVTDENRFPRHRFRFATVPQLARDFAGFFPAEGEAVRSYYRDLEEAVRQLLELQDPGVSFKPDRHGAFAAFWGRTTADVILERFQHPELRALALSVQAGYMPDLPWTMSAYHLYMIRNYYRDLYLPAGGSQELPNALARAIVRRGGDVATGTLVERIAVAGDRATGVELAGGRRIAARRAVVSNADAHLTYDRLLAGGDAPPEVRAFLARDITPSYFVVNLGLDIDLPAMGFDITHIQHYPTYDVLRMYRDILGGRIPPDYWMWVGFPSVSDPHKAPPGKSTMFLAIFAPYECEERWHSGPGYAFDGVRPAGPPAESYAEFKERLANDAIQRAESIIPGLGRHIAVRDVLTPISYERVTLNHRAASVGWRFGPRELRQRGSRFGLPRRTHVEGLFLCGGWTETGTGCFPVALGGEIAAYEVLGRSWQGLYGYSWDERAVREVI